MSEVFIDIRKENDWIKKYFNTDWVSVEQLLACIEDLDYEVFELKEQIKENQRSEIDKYQDWLSEQADLHNDMVNMGNE